MAEAHTSSDWIDQLDDAEWLHGTVLRLIEYYGVEQFKRKRPLLIQNNHTHLRESSPRRYLTAIAKDMCTAARIPINDIVVDLYQEKNAATTLSDLGIPHETEGQSGTAGVFHHIDAGGTARIAIEENQLKDEIALAGTLAHELAHVFLHIKRPPTGERWQPQDEEPVTDVTAVLLGFGTYLCNSAERFRGYTDGHMAGWSASRQGYLTLEELCYTQAFLHVFYEQDFREYKSDLTANPRHFVRAGIPRLETLLQELKDEDLATRRLHEQQAAVEEPTQIAAISETQVKAEAAPAPQIRAAHPAGKETVVSRPMLAALPFICVLLVDMATPWLLSDTMKYISPILKGLLVFSSLYWYRVLTASYGHSHNHKNNRPALVLRVGAHGLAVMAIGMFLLLYFAIPGLLDFTNPHSPSVLDLITKLFFNLMIVFGAILYYGFVSGRFRT